MRKKPFKNPFVKNVRRHAWDFLFWKLGYYNDNERRTLLPKDFKYPRKERYFSKNNPWCVWINHCTFLIHTSSGNILTDPVWSNCCSPITFLGPKRRHSPGIFLENLPQIDTILISHNHYDHLDKRTVLELVKKYPKAEWIVPIGVKNWFKKQKISNVRELGWWNEGILDKGMHITAVPSQHFSGRGIWDKNRTLWNGYVIHFKDGKIDKNIYFSGDTGYNSYHFKKIGKKWNKMDLSLIPIGTYIPRKFMKAVHINPDEAVKIHQDVKSEFSIGMHWKTFRLSDEPLEMPPYALYLSMKKEKIPFKNFIPIDPGTYVNF